MHLLETTIPIPCNVGHTPRITQDLPFTRGAPGLLRVTHAAGFSSSPTLCTQNFALLFPIGAFELFQYIIIALNFEDVKREKGGSYELRAMGYGLEMKHASRMKNEAAR